MIEDTIRDEPSQDADNGAIIAALPDTDVSSDSTAISQRRLTNEEKGLLLKLLVAGQREGLIVQAFAALGLVPPASATIAYYREKYREEIREAQAKRIEQAMTEGLALKAERIAKLKEHAELLEAMRFLADRNGRLWNERAWRQTLGDIAEEMGERRPKEEASGGETVKVIIGIDPAKV
jgi:hypothetical protein